jgi:transposase
MHIASIGVDLGKTTFHLVALGAQGKVVVRKKFSRKQLLAYTANLQSSLVGIEACSGAHFIGAALRSQGHDVRLIPAQFVKFYVKSNKNDFPRCGSRRRSGGAAATAERPRANCGFCGKFVVCALTSAHQETCVFP